jgi:hypothetical protein
MRLRLFGLLFVILSLVALFLYFFYDYSYSVAVDRFTETQCTVTSRYVETIDFHELCPSTMNYRFHFNVTHPLDDHLEVASTTIPFVAVGAISRLSASLGLDSGVPSDVAASAPVPACSGTSLTCYTGETDTGSECNRCDANSIHQCHKHVSLNANDYPEIAEGAVVPCWVFKSSAEFRIFLDDPSDIADYPQLEKYWIVICVVISVLCILASIYLLLERFSKNKKAKRSING